MMPMSCLASVKTTAMHITPASSQSPPERLNAFSWATVEIKGLGEILLFSSAGLNQCFHWCRLVEFIYW